MWHEYLFEILKIINYIILVLIGIPLLIQVLYILFFFVKKKKFPVATKKGKIAYLIPAHNEEDVVSKTIVSLLNDQNYPKDLYDVFLVAHNCTDETAKRAEEAGAKVLILNDPDPTHRKALYPLRYGIDEIISGKYGDYDMVIHVDADNLFNKDFSLEMNNAFQSGVSLARPYEGASNGTKNFFTKACAMFYVMESRYGSRVRERLSLGAHVNGSGAMMSVQMLKDTGGYDCQGVSDDTEYYFNRLLDGYKGHYVEDAVVYEDMPSSFSDTYNRNKRIGSGNNWLFRKKLPLLLKKFFKTGDLSCLEVFMTYILLVLTVPLSIWLPLYYIYHFTYLGLTGYGVIETTLNTAPFYQNELWVSLWAILGVVLSLFILFGYVQAFILAMTEYKKLGAKSRREYLPVALLFPFFLILYSITICIGMLSKPKKWGQAKRTTSKIN